MRCFVPLFFELTKRLGGQVGLRTRTRNHQPFCLFDSRSRKPLRLPLERVQQTLGTRATHLSHCRKAHLLDLQVLHDECHFTGLGVNRHIRRTNFAFVLFPFRMAPRIAFDRLHELDLANAVRQKQIAIVLTK